MDTKRGIFFLGVILIIIVSIYYIVKMFKGLTSYPPSPSVETDKTYEISISDLNFERTLNPDKSNSKSDIVGYTIEYDEGINFKELSKNVTFTINWKNNIGFTGNVEGFMIDHYVSTDDGKTFRLVQSRTLLKKEGYEININNYEKNSIQIISNGLFSVIGKNRFSIEVENKRGAMMIYDGRAQENDSSHEITITKDQLGATLSMTKSETVKYIPVTNTFSKSYSIKKARYSIFNSSTSLNKGNNYIYLIPAFVGDDNNDETFFFKYEDGDFLLENLTKGEWNGKTEREPNAEFDSSIYDNRMFLTFYNKKEEAFTISSMELRKSIMGYGTSSSIITSDEEGNLLLMSIGDTNPISETQFNNMRWNFIKYGNDIGGYKQDFIGGNTWGYFGYRVSLYGKYLVCTSIGESTISGAKARLDIYELKDDGLFGNNKSFIMENSNSGYGQSVSIYDKYIFVGAIYEGGININRGGAVYIYKLNEEGVWNLYRNIEGEQENSKFGNSVSISDKYAFVGAVNEDDGKGAVYIYKLNEEEGDWKKYDKIEGSIPEGKFGYHVSVSGNNLIVCAYNENEGDNKGTVYIYELKNNKWTYVVKFKGEANNNGDYFGNHASISDKYAIVGLCHENYSKGAVYLYERNEEDGVWNLYKKIEGIHENMRFGSGVSFYNNYFMVTAQHNFLKGSVYIYDIRDPMLSPVITNHTVGSESRVKGTYFEKSLCLTDKYAVVGSYNEYWEKGRLFVWKK